MSLKELYLETMRLSDAREHEAFLDSFTADCEWVVPGARLRGREEFRAWLEPFWTGFSSYRHEISTLLEEPGKVAAEGTFTGVNDGPMATPAGELPATNREITFRFAMVSSGDPAVGKASSVRIYFDQLELLGQLGALEGAAVA